MSDAAFMRRALELARKGLGRVEPNPCVGAVIVKKDRIVAEGFHAKFGGPHAEIVALRKAGKRARGATLYVTLEPCTHFGKTPPCSNAIERAGIKRIVAATRDPNPVVKRRLAMEVGLLGREARALNPRVARPYVIAKWAMTADGKLATRTGDSKWISSATSRRRSHAERSGVQAILVGAETVIQDDPKLRGTKVRAILDGRLRVSAKAKVMRPGTILYTCSKGSRPCEVVREKTWTVKKVLRDLARRGVRRVLIEGGADVHRQALAEGVVDEVLIIVAPKIVGGVASMKSARRIRVTSMSFVGGDVWIRGRL